MSSESRIWVWVTHHNSIVTNDPEHPTQRTRPAECFDGQKRQSDKCKSVKRERKAEEGFQPRFSGDENTNWAVHSTNQPTRDLHDEWGKEQTHYRKVSLAVGYWLGAEREQLTMVRICIGNSWEGWCSTRHEYCNCDCALWQLRDSIEDNSTLPHQDDGCYA